METATVTVSPGFAAHAKLGELHERDCTGEEGWEDRSFRFSAKLLVNAHMNLRAVSVNGVVTSSAQFQPESP